VPVLRDLLGTDPLSLTDWAWCLGVSVLPGLGVFAVKRAARRAALVRASAG
jgi:hypothetical protein